jgi:carotenoid cleavage dioxygenase-like enzyme
VLFPVIPQTCDLERLKAGGEHWQWNSKIPFYIGVLPRHGARGDDVRWFRAPNAFPGHTANAYENDAGSIVFDLALSDKNVFFWWPDAEGNAPNPHEIHAEMVRFIIDPYAHDLDVDKHEVLVQEDCEFARIDERVSMQQYRHMFFDMMRPDLDTNFEQIAPVMGGGFAPYNSIGHYDLQAEKLDTYFAGTTHLVQEPIFIPRNCGTEGDGWVVVLVNNYATMSSELHVVDTRDFSRAQAKVLIPIRLRAGLHGNWVARQDLSLLS